MKNEQVKKGSKNQLAFSNRRLPKVADFLTDSLYETGCLGELNGSEPADDLQESRVQSIESAKSLCLCFCLPESCQVELFQFLDYRSITPRDDPLLDNFHNIAPDSERLHYESVVLHWVALTKIVANLRIRALKKALIQRGTGVSGGLIDCSEEAALNLLLRELYFPAFVGRRSSQQWRGWWGKGVW